MIRSLTPLNERCLDLVNLTGHFWLTKPVFNRILAPGQSVRASEVFVKVRNEWSLVEGEERVALPLIDLPFHRPFLGIVRACGLLSRRRMTVKRWPI
jgi:hypothetical protein